MQCNAMQCNAMQQKHLTADKSDKFAALKAPFRFICSSFSFPLEIQ